MSDRLEIMITKNESIWTSDNNIRPGRPGSYPHRSKWATIATRPYAVELASGSLSLSLGGWRRGLFIDLLRSLRCASGSMAF